MPATPPKLKPLSNNRQSNSIVSATFFVTRFFFCRVCHKILSQAAQYYTQWGTIWSSETRIRNQSLYLPVAKRIVLSWPPFDTQRNYIPTRTRSNVGLFSVTFGPLFIKINVRGNASPLRNPTDFRFHCCSG